MSLLTYDEAVLEAQALSGPNISNCLPLVAQYLDDRTLARGSRVNKEWYQVCSGQLWADPLRYIIDSTEPFTRARDFFLFACYRTIEAQYLRPKVSTLDWGKLLKRRSQCPSDWNRWDHEFNGFNALATMLLFPNLKFAILDDLKDFQDGTLMDLAQEQRERLMEYGISADLCEVIVFSAAGCHGLDFSLSLGSDSMANLWFLDISFTSCDEGWLRRFTNVELPNLRVLKLQGLRLTDRGFIAIKSRLGNKLWSLDLSQNNLTDFTISKILDSMPPALPLRPKPDPNGPAALSLYYEDPPLYAKNDQYAGRVNGSIASIRPDSKHVFIEYIKRHGHISTRHTPVLEERDSLSRVTGITHLYLERNKFTSVGIRNLLNGTNRLQVLDIGSVRTEPPLVPGSLTYAQLNCVSPLLSTSGSRLERLRIHHSMVTHTPSALDGDPPTETQNREKINSSENIGRHECFRWSAFNPNDNHRITELKLTGIPTKSEGLVVRKLIKFLKQCAEQETHINEIRASQGRQTRRSPRLLSGLQNLTLEFMPQARTLQRAPPTSVSGDRDAENFLSQQMNDFSFFTSDSQPRENQPATPILQPPIPLLDVPTELKRFRATEKGKKWTGEIKIIRGNGSAVPTI